MHSSYNIEYINYFFSWCSNNALWSFPYLSTSSNEQVQCCGHGLPLKKFSTYQGIMMAEGKKWLTLQLLLLLFYTHSLLGSLGPQTVKVSKTQGLCKRTKLMKQSCLTEQFKYACQSFSIICMQPAGVSSSGCYQKAIRFRCNTETGCVEDHH